MANWIKMKCYYCGKEILLKPNELDKFKHFYCSVECHNNKQREYGGPI